VRVGRRAAGIDGRSGLGRNGGLPSVSRWRRPIERPFLCDFPSRRARTRSYTKAPKYGPVFASPPDKSFGLRVGAAGRPRGGRHAPRGRGQGDHSLNFG
jgi:hypothetical protein